MEFDLQGNPLPVNTPRNIKRAAKRKKALINNAIKEREKKLMDDITSMRMRKRAKQLVDSSSDSEVENKPFCPTVVVEDSDSDEEFVPFKPPVKVEDSESEEEFGHFSTGVDENDSEFKGASKPSSSTVKEKNSKPKGDSGEVEKPLSKVIIKNVSVMTKPVTIVKKEQNASKSPEVNEVGNGSGEDGSANAQVLFCKHV